MLYFLRLLGALAPIGLFAAFSAAAAIPASERDALIAFYQATGGQNWSSKTGWLGAPGTECQWTAVECDSASTTVTGLYFWGNNNLVGVVPPDVRNLTGLKHLYLNNNYLTSLAPELYSLPSLEELSVPANSLSGPIPDAVGNAPSLKVLNLGENALSGPIPASLGRLTKLTTLNLEYTSLSGPIPKELGLLVNLTELLLENDQLSGPIPKELGNLRSLQNLVLWGNALSGAIPPELGDLASLQSLSLSNNKLEGPIPRELGKLAALKNLYLDTNGLTGSVPPELGSLKSLVELTLNDNTLSGTLPKELGSLTNATLISLASNAFTGAVPSEFGNLTSLQALYLNNNKLTDPNAAALARLAKLQVLELPWNSFSGPIPASLGNLTALRRLELQGSGFSGAIPTALGNLPNLEGLYLYQNQLTGEIPTVLGGLAKLQELALSSNQLTGKIPSELGSLPALEGLWLDGNQLNGSIPPELGNLAKLSRLVLHDNLLTGNIPGELSRLANLEELLLYSNRLGGSIPSLSGLTKLTALDLGDNALVGQIPPLAPLANLQRLVLTTNQLGGTIPSDISTLTRLEALRLDSNLLSGQIPSGIGNLASLSYVDLSGNQLSGSIPSSLGSLSKLTDLYLQSNQLSGQIPVQLGSLNALQRLRLTYNQLSGSIPPELGNLPNLLELQLDNNQLSGQIPAALGRLPLVDEIGLQFNKLSGAIPSDLGNARTLQGLYLAGNTLAGAVPPSLTNLTNLHDGWGLDLRWNALSTEDVALRTFINRKGYYFDATQTIPPTDVGLVVASTASVTIRWNPILYQDDPGGYLVLFAPNAAGPFAVGATTTSKEVTSATVPGLSPGTTYTFAVQAFTNPHPYNANKVTSVTSATVSGRTSDPGAVAITLTPGSQRILTDGSGTITATLSASQPNAQTMILSSSNTSVATVPASVTVAAGSTTATIPVAGHRVGTVTIIAAISSFVGTSSAAADVTVDTSTCERPDRPGFTAIPSSAVRAGNSFTLSWTPTLASDPAGTYQLDVYPTLDCSGALQRYTLSSPSLTLPTAVGQAASYCAVVRAISGTGCVGDGSGQASISVQPGPAAFVVVQPQSPEAITTAGTAPSPSTVVFQNIGSQASAITIAASGGFFSASPSSVSSVAPGASVTVTLTYDPLVTVSEGVKFGSLCVSWTDATTPSSTPVVCTAVTMTSLRTPPAHGAGGKLVFDSSNEVHFIAAKGSPPPQQLVTIVNTGSTPARIAPSIGPGGAWLTISGDLVAPIPPGGSRTLSLGVDRTKRTNGDGNPPITSNVTFANADGVDDDRAVLQAFDEEPGTIGDGRNRPFLKTGEYSLTLGSSVSASGAGTLFLSDGWIRNKSAGTSAVDLYYTPGGTDGIGYPQVKRASLTIQPYATYRLADFVRGLFDVSGSGSVEVRSSRISDLSVRTTVDSLTPKAGGLARLGAEIPTVQSDQGTSPGRNNGASLFLTGLKGGTASGFRTNVILSETSGAPVTVALKLVRADGTELRQRQATVPAYSKQQINYNDTSLFPGDVNYDGASMEIQPVSGDGTVVAFATVIDNASQGYTTRLGRFVTDTAAPAAPKGLRAAAVPRRVIPTAAHATGRNNSLFTTRVSLTNGTSVAATVTVRYLPGSGTPPAAKAVTVPGRGTVTIPDIIGSLFGITDNTAGMIVLEGADVVRLVAASETSTPLDLLDSRQGISPSTLAAYAPGAPEAVGDPKAGALSSIVLHPGLEESTRFRTNLIFAEVSGQPVQVKVKLIPAGSGGVPLAEKVYPLGANQWLQVNSFIKDITGQADGVQNLDVETTVEWLSGSGRALVVATKIDNDPASKRSDVYVLGPVGALQGTIGF